MIPSRFLLAALIVVLSSVTAQAGSISGTIKYEGDVPNLKPIKMDADPICLSHHSNEVLPQILILGDNKELANVFVRVISGLPKTNYPAPTEPVVINQQGCMYDPHVAGVMVGQPVQFLNPDGTLHNIHALPKKNAEFNIAMPKFRKEITQTFDKPEFMFPVKCDVHPWMGAWISVMEHPFFSVTDTTGTYKIANLPPGEYQIEAWHEKLGTQKETVTITGDETQETNFTFSRPSN